MMDGTVDNHQPPLGENNSFNSSPSSPQNDQNHLLQNNLFRMMLARQQQAQQQQQQQQQASPFPTSITNFVWKFPKVEEFVYQFFYRLYDHSYGMYFISSNPKDSSSFLSSQISSNSSKPLLSNNESSEITTNTSTISVIENSLSSSSVTTNSPLTKFSQICSQIHQFFLFWVIQSGIVQLFSIFIMYLQLLSLILLPSLQWDPISKFLLTDFSIIRNLHLHLLFTNPNDSILLGQFLNYYIPFAFSFFNTIFILFLFALATISKWKWINRCLSLYIQCSPALLIPVCNGYLNTWNCVLNRQLVPNEVNIDFPQCIASFHIIFVLISLVGYPIYALVSGYLYIHHYEWKPDSFHLCSRTHTRFDVVQWIFILFLHLMTSFFELFSVVLLFLDFVVLLLLIGLLIFFMPFYKTMVNQMVLSQLFVCLFGCMISILVGTFMMIFSQFEYFIAPFPGLALLASICIAIYISMLLCRIRITVMAFMIHSPSPLQRLVYQLHENEVLVPRGELEVEMASRVVHFIHSVSLLEKQTLQLVLQQGKPYQQFRNKEQELNERKKGIQFTEEFEQLLEEVIVQQQQQEQQQQQSNTTTVVVGGLPSLQTLPQDIWNQNLTLRGVALNPQRNDLSMMNTNSSTNTTTTSDTDSMIQKVDDMYRTALELIHNNSFYVYLNYATYNAQVLGKVKRALTILTLMEHEMKRVYWPDYRFMLYMRRRAWQKQLAQQQ